MIIHSNQSCSASEGGSHPPPTIPHKDSPLQMFPISQGWAKGNFITKVTIRENMKKAKEQKEEYKRLTRDFEVK
jgi:hypothetical protein